MCRLLDELVDSVFLSKSSFFNILFFLLFSAFLSPPDFWLKFSFFFCYMLFNFSFVDLLMVWKKLLWFMI